MMWWVILACAIAFGTKLLGYLLPAELLERQRFLAVMAATTIGLLGALVSVSAVTSKDRLVLDARLLAVVAAAVALRLRAPFIVVVLAGVVAVALGRALGLP
ncbi:MAG: AzlD domain-containing protein [Propionibacteriaceae bacterium]|nr:AzlD domain-containing protein [Propionibacteriaceae bacterium]